MAPLDTVFGWLRCTLSLDGSAWCCLWMDAVVEWTLLLDGSAGRCRWIDTVVEWRLSFPVVLWDGCAMEGCCCRIMWMWNYVCVEQCWKSIQIASREKANGVLIFWIWQIVVKVIE